MSPFAKGNKLASVQKGKPKARTQQWDNLIGWLVSDGGSAFKDKIKTLSEGGEITAPEKEFLGHYKDLLEYHRPKLSRSEQTVVSVNLTDVLKQIEGGD